MGGWDESERLRRARSGTDTSRIRFNKLPETFRVVFLRTPTMASAQSTGIGERARGGGLATISAKDAGLRLKGRGSLRPNPWS